MVTRNNLSPDEQLALVPDTVERLQQFSQPILSENWGSHQRPIKIFFVVINLPNSSKEAHSFVANVSVEAVVAITFLCKILAMLCTVRDKLQWPAAVIVSRQIWMLKTINFDGLLVNELHTQLQARGMTTSRKLRDELQADLIAILKGAPTQKPSQTLADLNSHRYEVLTTTWHQMTPSESPPTDSLSPHT